MADIKITDLVDQQAFDQLQKLQQEIDSVEQQYAQAARVLIQGLKVKVEVVGDLDKLTTIANSGMQQAAQATQQLTRAVQQQTVAVGQTTNVISRELSEVEKLNKAQRQQVDLDKDAVSMAREIVGTYQQQVQNLARVETELKAVSKQKKDLDDQYKSGAITQAQYQSRLANVIATERELKGEKKEIQQLMSIEEKMNLAVKGSYKELAQQLNMLEQAYMRLTEDEKQSPFGKRLAEAQIELKQHMKDLDADMGNFQRNVGDYAIAGASLKSQLKDLVLEIATLTVEYRNMSEEERAGAKGQELAKKIAQLTEDAGALKDAIVDTNDAIKNAASDTRAIDQIGDALQTVAATFAVAKGAASAFGIETAEVEKAEQQLMGVIALMNGLQTIQNKLQEQSALMQGIRTVKTRAATVAENLDTAAKSKNIIVSKAATAAQAAFNLVAKANPYVLLAAAIMSVVGALYLFINRGKSAEDTQARFNKTLESTSRELKRISDDADFDVAIAEAAGKSVDEINQIRYAAAKAADELAYMAYNAAWAKYKAGEITEEQLDAAREQMQSASDHLVEALRQWSVDSAKVRLGKKSGSKSGGSSSSSKDDNYAENIDKELAEARIRAIADAEEREKAELRKQYEDKIKTIKGNSDKETELRSLLLKEMNDKISDIEKKYEDERKKSEEEKAAKQLEDAKKKHDDRLQELEKAFAVESQLRNDAFVKEQTELEKQYSSGTITKEQYEKKKSALSEKYAQESAQAQIDYLQGVLEEDVLTSDERQDIERKLASAKINLEKQIADAAVKGAEDAAEADKKSAKERIAYAQQVMQVGMDAANAAADLASAIFERQSQELDEKSEKNQAAHDAEIANIERLEETGAISKEEAENRKRAAERKTKAEEEKIAKQKAALQLKQAKMEKAMNIMQIIMNTATAIMRCWSDAGPLAGGPLAAMVSAIGAIQLAAAIAQPLPKYKDGTAYHPGGPAIVGDGGKVEGIILPNGKAFLTPDSPTMVNLPAGAKVIPDAARAMRLDSMNPTPLVGSERGTAAEMIVVNDYSSLQSSIDRQTDILVRQMRQQKKIARDEQYARYISERM